MLREYFSIFERNFKVNWLGVERMAKIGSQATSQKRLQHSAEKTFYYPHFLIYED